MHNGLIQLMYFNLHPPTPSPFLSLIVGLSAVCCLLWGDGRLRRDLCTNTGLISVQWHREK